MVRWSSLSLMFSIFQWRMSIDNPIETLGEWREFNNWRGDVNSFLGIQKKWKTYFLGRNEYLSEVCDLTSVSASVFTWLYPLVSLHSLLLWISGFDSSLLFFCLMRINVIIFKPHMNKREWSHLEILEVYLEL